MIINYIGSDDGPLNSDDTLVLEDYVYDVFRLKPLRSHVAMQEKKN